METARARGQRPGTGAVLAKKLGAALAVIVVTSGAFAFIGTLDDEPTGDPVAAGDDAPTDEPTTDESTSEPVEPTPSDPPADPEPTDEATSEEPEPEPTSEEPTEEASEDPEPDPEPEAEPEPEPEEPEPSEPAATIPPGEITIQVLDGYKADGGAAMRNLSEDLRGQGYRVVAENQAIDYDVTTVLWTQGNEAAARQVAAAIGAGEVRPQPGNLSESVSVHIVVGADRG